MIPRVVLAGIAAAALVAGHALDYLVAVPDAAERHALMVATGHAWMHPAAVGAVVAAAASVVAALGAGLAGARAPTLRGAAPKLALVQSAVFLAIELVERTATGTTGYPRTLLLLALGLAIQTAASVPAAAVVCAMWRAGARVARDPVRLTIPRAPVRSAPVACAAGRGRVALADAAARAPPLAPAR